MGLVGWGAGSFDTSYILSLTPSEQNNQLVDNQLMQQCVIAKWAATTGAASSPAAAAPPSSASASQVTVTSRLIVMTTLDPTPAMTLPQSIGDMTYTMTLSMITEAAGGDGEDEGLLTASGSPTLPAVATQVPTSGAGGLQTASGGTNGTAQVTSPSGSGAVTASGAQGAARLSTWATVLMISVGFVFTFTMSF